jgi:hypothetical protein
MYSVGYGHHQINIDMRINTENAMKFRGRNVDTTRNAVV